jgi:hypothetical protein
MRNQIFDGLMTLGASIKPGPGGADNWGETGRKLKDYTTAQLPALFQVEGDTDYRSMLGQAARRAQQVTWVMIHAKGADQAEVPATYSADWIDSVEAKLTQPVNLQTLGGLVFACYIEGAIRRFSGDLDGIEMVIVPLIVLLP